MTKFGEELIKAMTEAVAHAEGKAVGYRVHHPIDPREVRKTAKLTQKEMAPLMGMSVSGYRKWEQGRRTVSGPAEVLLRVMAREPEAFRRAVQTT
ncbi:MAG: helix-turn-helix domain-containing protein [Rhodobacteraceae bacterium]|nr:helix-turn-helix domain-containing protein [Paracoccaceae bacterium]MXZ50447.1 helix-turn-helix domain-containing protein [Paracoccaceae bacterium]MYF46326.1 helix-turn-helix domain-containing protein [Paracoccaceae bacterium]MYG09544.1 helix-turn-helix domain-containing protein [Paracoccaceae bacterium]MYI91961.1 helix-turn-helix domain-containing protein [Paracoccaceae bacterium]